MEKKKPNYFMRVVFFLFFLYLITFILNETGYYEAKVSKETKITESAIKEFEEDVEKGEVIDLNKYLDKDEKEYSNFLTKTTDKINKSFISVLNDGFKETWNVLKFLFW